VRPRLGEHPALPSGGRGAGSASPKHLTLVASLSCAAPSLLIVTNDLSSLLADQDGPGAELELSLTLAHLVNALMFCDGCDTAKGEARPRGAPEHAAAASAGPATGMEIDEASDKASDATALRADSGGVQSELLIAEVRKRRRGRRRWRLVMERGGEEEEEEVVVEVVVGGGRG
jgi:hypothetical protein